MSQSRYFIACHDFMIHDLKLKGFSLLIYALLYNCWTCYKTRYLSVRIIQEKCGCSRRQVYECVKHLIEKKLVLEVVSEIVYIDPVRAELAQYGAEIAHVSYIKDYLGSTYLKETLEEYEKRKENKLSKKN